jgi:lactate dehydrogenase-like 2-hydroxyacid dehydrogenase
VDQPEAGKIGRSVANRLERGNGLGLLTYREVRDRQMESRLFGPGDAALLDSLLHQGDALVELPALTIA